MVLSDSTIMLDLSCNNVSRQLIIIDDDTIGWSRAKCHRTRSGIWSVVKRSVVLFSYSNTARREGVAPGARACVHKVHTRCLTLVAAIGLAKNAHTNIQMLYTWAESRVRYSHASSPSVVLHFRLGVTPLIGATMMVNNFVVRHLPPSSEADNYNKSS